jgi:DNA-binding beta-propeller fold protein YncE
MLDPNNRPGGPNLILTAKNANKVQFFDAATLAVTGEIQMPASTHEMALSPDGKKVFASVYGGGIFGKNSNPDRRIAVIDLPSRTLERTIDVGGVLAPHGLMFFESTLWATGELGDAVLAVDPASDRVERIDLGVKPHWLAVSHPARKVFAALKSDHFVVVIDPDRREPVDRVRIPHRVEGVCTSPDGETLYVCAHEKGEFHLVDARSHAIRRSVEFESVEGGKGELRRVRASPDGRYVLLSSSRHNHMAIFEADGLRQTASVSTGKSPMGFGFSPDGKHAYLCCHDDAFVMVIELSTGRMTGKFDTDKGCEFIIAYR